MAIMHRFHAEKADPTAVTLRFTADLLSRHADYPIGGMAPVLAKNLRELRVYLEDFGLHFSLIHLDRIISILSGNIKTDSGNIAEQINDLHQRIYDELSSTYCIRLAKEQADLFALPVPLFGTTVAGKFQFASFEIEEAGKCLALRRSTAVR